MSNIEFIKNCFEKSIQVKKDFLADAASLKKIEEAALAIARSYEKGGKVIVFGNGGSAADGQHMSAEFVVRFEKERKSLPCIALDANTSIITACGNDYEFDRVFSRQIESLALPGDIVIAISTSGNSPNVLEAVRAARDKGVFVIALGGKDGGKLKELADIPIIVKENITARVQEVHILIIHVICGLVDSMVK